MAVIELFRVRDRRFNSTALIAAHLIIIAGLLGVAALALMLRRPLAGAVPSLQEIRSDLWTAVAAATLGTYLVHLSRGHAPSTGEVLAVSKSRLPDGLWELAAQEARHHDSDPQLVRAILLVENLQRPEWLRQLERVKGLLIADGTYGVMQVRSPSPDVSWLFGW